MSTATTVARFTFPTANGVRNLADLPDDPISKMVPLEAPAGSIVVMEGRLWHTSGRNITADEDRALLFGYYTKPYVRPQWNFTVTLRPEIQAELSPLMRYRLGLDATLNIPAEEIFGTEPEIPTD